MRVTDNPYWFTTAAASGNLGPTSDEIASVTDLLAASRSIGDLFAVLDTARHEAVYRWLFDHQDRVDWLCLYQGKSAEEFAEVAPYLIRFDESSSLYRRFIGRSWGRSWNIWIRAQSDLNGLRRSLRQLTMVNGPDDARYLFRVFDPRVLRLFLPTATGDQLDVIFATARLFVCEGAVPSEAIFFRPGATGLERQDKRLFAKRSSVRRDRPEAF